MYDFFCNGYGLAGGFWFMWIFWILLIGVVIGLVVWLVNRATKPQAPTAQLSTPSGSGALAILKERYARGEITHEEFESMRNDILS